MKHDRFRYRLVAVAVLLGLVGISSGVGSETVSFSTPRALAEGTLDGTLIDAEGRLALAPRVDTLWGPEEGIVWQVSHDGHQGVFAGLSGPARLLHVDADGTSEVWHRPDDEQLFTAVAAEPGGGVILGRSPSGELWRFRGPEDGEKIADTDAAFIWALEFSPEGDLWVGTGLPGRVLRVVGDRTEVIYETFQDPVRCLLPLSDGGVLVGTGGQGHLMRIAPDGSPFVLYDAVEPEVVAIARDDEGVIYALAVGGARLPGRPNGSAATPRPPVGQTVRVTLEPDGASGEPAVDDGEDDARRDRPEKEKAGQSLSAVPGGTIYRIETDGSVHIVWSTIDELPFAMQQLPDGRLLVATGDRGRLHAIDPQTGQSSRLLRVAANQASALDVDDDGGIWVGATQDARVERVGPGRRESGSYRSPVVDAGTIAEWGRVIFRNERPEDGAVVGAIRVGNTASPDGTWSDWASLDVADRRLPAARRAQIRLQLEGSAGDTPRIGSLAVHYRSQNRDPQIVSLEIEAPGVIWVAGPAQSSSRLGPVIANDPIARRALAALSRKPVRPNGAVRKGYEPGARTFRWRALDADGDRLQFTLEVRREGSRDWFPIARNLTENYLSWDARAVPDGAYRVRLTVHDGLDHPEGEGRSDRRVSELFELDNTRPRLTELEVRVERSGWRVEFAALDPDGAVAAVETALDGGPWQIVTPLDGVADSAEERFEIRVEGDGRNGERSLQIRVTDAAGNLGGRMQRLVGEKRN